MLEGNASGIADSDHKDQENQKPPTGTQLNLIEEESVNLGSGRRLQCRSMLRRRHEFRCLIHFLLSLRRKLHTHGLRSITNTVPRYAMFPAIPEFFPEAAGPFLSSPFADPSMFLSSGEGHVEGKQDGTSLRVWCRENHTSGRVAPTWAR